MACSQMWRNVWSTRRRDPMNLESSGVVSDVAISGSHPAMFRLRKVCFVILSAAKNLGRMPIQARFFAALRMTALPEKNGHPRCPLWLVPLEKFAYIAILLSARRRRPNHASERPSTRMCSSSSRRVYVGGTLGDDYDHRRLNRLVAAGGARGPRRSEAITVRATTSSSWPWPL